MAVTSTVPNFFQNDFGFLLTFSLKDATGKAADLSSSTHFTVRIVKPLIDNIREVNEHGLTQTAIIDAAKGIVGYVVEEGDLDTLGSYLIQLSDVTPGRRLTSVEQRFVVKPTVERFIT